LIQQVTFLGYSEKYYTPIARAALVPTYVRVDLLGADAASEALLASSALPLGVVAARRNSDGGSLVDGGVADNVPWFPLISENPCDELVVVHCNPSRTWNNESALNEWQSIDRLRRVVNRKLVPISLTYNKWTRDYPPPEIPSRRPAHWPHKVVAIAPTQSLGGFVKGTMWFSRQSCRKNMEDGYLAGRCAIESSLSPDFAVLHANRADASRGL
jgi:hypothetical protein